MITGLGLVPIVVPTDWPYAGAQAPASKIATGRPARTFHEAIDMDGTHVRIAILCGAPSRNKGTRAVESLAFGEAPVSAERGSVGPLNRGLIYQ